jgi:hypothetical protein
MAANNALNSDDITNHKPVLDARSETSPVALNNGRLLMKHHDILSLLSTSDFRLQKNHAYHEAMIAIYCAL